MKKLFATLVMVLVVAGTAWAESRPLADLTFDNFKERIKKQAQLDGLWMPRFDRQEESPKLVQGIYDLSPSASLIIAFDRHTRHAVSLTFIVALNPAKSGDEQVQQFMVEIAYAVNMAAGMTIPEYRLDKELQSRFLNVIGPFNPQCGTEDQAVTSPDGKTEFATTFLNGKYILAVGPTQ